MANGPCRPATARRRAVPARWGSCLDGPSCLPCRASTGFVPGLRPMARPVGSLTVLCRPLGTAIFLVPCRSTAQQPKNISFSPVLNKIPSFSSSFSQKLTDSHSPQYHTITNHNTREKTKRQGYMKMMIKRSCFVQCCLIKNLRRTEDRTEEQG